VKKRLSVLLFSLVLLSSLAIPAFAAENAAPGTVIQAKAPSVYVISAPVGATVTAPQNQCGLGCFQICDLFLEEGEWLSAALIPGPLTHDPSGHTMPYQVQCSLPPVIGMSNIGEACQATAIVDANALADAYRGTYRAVLTFRVVSHPDGKIVWQGTSVLTLEVPYGAEWDEPESTAAEASSAPQPVSPGPSVPPVPSTPSKPKTSSKTTPPPTSSQGEPGKPPYMGAAVRYAGPAAAVALLMTALIAITAGTRRKNKNR